MKLVPSAVEWSASIESDIEHRLKRVLSALEQVEDGASAADQQVGADESALLINSAQVIVKARRDYSHLLRSGLMFVIVF